MNENNKYEMPDIESSTADYASRFAGLTGQWLLQVQKQATREALQGIEPSSVLDAGGGHGQNIEPVCALGHTLTVLGSDPSCAQLIQGDINTQKINFIMGYLTAMPFAENSFDIVMSYRMLPHLESWSAHIVELTRVAKRMVIVDYPSKKSFNFLADSLFSWKLKVEKNTRHYTCFHEQEVDKIFQACGFQRSYRYPQFFLPMALHRALKSPRISMLLESVCRVLGFTRLFGSPIISAYVPKN